jgi:hypothetical protein
MQVFHLPIPYTDGLGIFLVVLGIMLVVWVIKFFLSFVTG